MLIIIQNVFSICTYTNNEFHSPVVESENFILTSNNQFSDLAGLSIFSKCLYWCYPNAEFRQLCQLEENFSIFVLLFPISISLSLLCQSNRNSFIGKPDCGFKPVMRKVAFQFSTQGPQLFTIYKSILSFRIRFRYLGQHSTCCIMGCYTSFNCRHDNHHQYVHHLGKHCYKGP